ncbi:FAD binding domain of DNA photolyase-domain-containing protein [Neohortaea acidophila]|uniref:FAD binding domain of DNA photolyase-domain-containing protein n=1 Tax=Neohortaea acidophila TaxID=245834 RepID=A0A6A6PWR5_9PEZI|nr:FAD binding domain of DNA photolyase-domain-containing protein [Neohortaea acidophila]KAF2484196.1 FAD binding domain of DNA photolyase-domain-containing protein [Neohortaea acidophila]
MAPRVIYWFRTDLRLHDSPALNAALDLKPEVLYPIWCWDSHYVYRARVGVNRWQFLLDCQQDVSKSISKLNKKSKLFVLREPAVTLLPKLFKAWNISHLVFEKDTDAYARERDAQVMELARKAGVEVIVKAGRTLWDSDELVKANDGKPTMSMSQVQKAAEKLGEPDKPVDTPKTLPDPGDMKLDFDQTQPKSAPDINEKHRDEKEGTYSAGIAGPNGDFSVPTLEELGMKPATTQHRGGESIALKMLDDIIANEEYTGTFEKPKTSPAAFEPQATCLTSPYLHFGALSVRYFYHKVQDVVEKRRRAKKAVSEVPVSLKGQLLFRDMYFGAQAKLGWSFGQTYNNSHCRFIPWHLPSKVDVNKKLITGEYEVDDEEKDIWFQRWAHGKTGFPWIDAIMRQLRQEGWIHHLARHSVACFLTRGGCYISWERGAEVFEELLIDHEAACNIGNWQWLSCTAFFSQFYRCYSPVAFGKKWDDNGDFIRKFVPELKDMPKKYIYEPHKAPIADQKKAGVLIKGDGEETERDGVAVYPKPMFDFNTQREICMQGMKSAYAVGFYGNSKAVMDGTWKKAFDDSGEGPTSGEQGGPAGLDSFEDADGTEELITSPPTAKRAGRNEGSTGSPKSTRGHKREHSQSTLEGSFKKKAR